jgi:hypothetical protein
MSKFYSDEIEEKGFLRAIHENSPLEVAVDWIESNLDVDKVFGDEEIFDYAVSKGYVQLDWICENKDPDAVFTERQLNDWAKENEYIHMDKIDEWAEENGYVRDGSGDSEEGVEDCEQD